MDVAERSQNWSTLLLRVAGLSVLLGIVIQILILLALALFGQIPTVRSIVADFAQKVSWSTVVCLGLAIAKAASRSNAAATGIGGLIAAPLGFTVAGVLQKTVAQMSQAVTSSAPAVSTVLLAIIKGLQYAFLGMLVCKVAKRMGGNWKAYLSSGLLAGLVFGGITLYLVSPLPVPALVARTINEVLFPVGCSFVLFAADVAGSRLQKVVGEII